MAPRALLASCCCALLVLRVTGARSATPTRTPEATATPTSTASITPTFLPWVQITTLAEGLRGPTAIATCLSGNSYVVDGDGNRVYKISPSGVMTSFAGTGMAGFGGDGGAATSAILNRPEGVAVDSAENVFISDMYNNRIRRVAAATGVISTIASLSYPRSITVDGRGESVFVSSASPVCIFKISVLTGLTSLFAGSGYGFSDGGAATSAQIGSQVGISLDSQGSLYIADSNFFRIRKITSIGNTSTISTIAGSSVSGYSGDGALASQATFSRPWCISVDGTGNIFVGDMNGNRVRKISAATGVITTVAGNGVSSFSGDGGAATSASIYGPTGIAIDPTGTILLIVDFLGNVRKATWISAVSASTTATPTPSQSPSPYCHPSLFRLLPRMDLVGTLVGSALAPGEAVTLPSEAACRQACCDAAVCHGYAFDAAFARSLGAAACYLLANVTQLVPSNNMASGVLSSAL